MKSVGKKFLLPNIIFRSLYFFTNSQYFSMLPAEFPIFMLFLLLFSFHYTFFNFSTFIPELCFIVVACWLLCCCVFKRNDTKIWWKIKGAKITNLMENRKIFLLCCENIVNFFFLRYFHYSMRKPPNNQLSLLLLCFAYSKLWALIQLVLN